MTKLLLLSVCCGFLLQEPPAPPKAAADGLVIPFDILASRHMAVEIRVNGKGPYRVIFDTGAPICLMSARIGREAELTAAKKDDKKENRRGGGLGMMAIGAPLKVDELQIGDVKVHKLPVMVFDHPTVKALANVLGGDLDGIIGFPFFARYRVTVDYRQRKMFLEPNGYEPGDVMASMMTLMMAPRNKPQVKQVGARTLWGFEAAKGKDDEAEGVAVAKVWEGSPAAEAGLQAGDRLLTLDGVWTESLEDCARAAAGVKPGRAAEAKILRAGKELRLTLRPRVGI